VVYDRDSKEAPGGHKFAGSCDIIGAWQWRSRRVIVRDNYGCCACGNGCPEYCSRLYCANTVLSTNGGDVGARDPELAVEEENCKVLAVGESNHRVERSCGAFAVRDRLFGKAEGAAGLDQAHFVDWNLVKR